MTKRLCIGFIMAFITLCAIPFSGIAQMVKAATCPVMPGERVKAKFFVDYQGKRIYLCCRDCEKAFKRHPKKYLKRLKEN